MNRIFKKELMIKRIESEGTPKQKEMLKDAYIIQMMDEIDGKEVQQNTWLLNTQGIEEHFYQYPDGSQVRINTRDTVSL